NGLVDELGGIDRAVDLVKQKAHIGAGERVTLVAYPGKRSVFDVLFDRSEESTDMELRVKKLLGHIPIQALSRGGFLKLMPYSIEVK
ncbi:MAG TPA: hypothetical protein VKG79_12010, partial [Bryobacteraceae bacterium]|nr:hypothetical protein [Bryobacteraceae bacterium]